MQTLLLALLLSADPGIAVSATTTGITAANLANTPTTSGVNMEEGRATNQLSLTLAVTPGTSLVVDVRCYESQSGTAWDQIALCDSVTPKSACHPDVRTFTLADYSGSVKYITTRWAIKKKYAKCSADDPADGSGTVTITGARSWQ